MNGDDKRKVREIIIETLQFRDGPNMELVDQIETIELHLDYPEQKIKIGGQLSPEEREEIITLIRDNLNVFTWKFEDLRVIKEEVVIHKLEVDPFAKPIKQTRRIFDRDKKDAIKEKVQKLLKAGIIKEVTYPVWLANVMMVKKHKGKWRMYVDFTDLKACPKDSYPLPRIDIPYQWASHPQFSRLLLKIPSYKMAEEAIDKTAFQSSRKGLLLCYDVI